MKTTIDLPDEILRRAKFLAIERGTSLKKLVIQGLETVLAKPDPEVQKQEALTKLVTGLRANNSEPMKPLTREEIYE